MTLHPIDIDSLRINPFTFVGLQWLAICAGTEERGYNAMCASWGQLGALWERRGPGSTPHRCLPTVSVFVRPQRHTRTLLDREEFFSVCSLPTDKRRALAYLGSHSGRDEDKLAASGLTPAFAPQGTVYIAESDLVFICRKLYTAPLQQEGFIDTSLIATNYPELDFHHAYVGEIVAAYASGRFDSQGDASR